MEVDLNKIIPKEFSLYNKVLSFRSNDSMPPCDPNYCFYLIQSVFEISQKQYEKLQVKDVEYNNREIGLGKKADWAL